VILQVCNCLTDRQFSCQSKIVLWNPKSSVHMFV